jgi:hypothetical protein
MRHGLNPKGTTTGVTKSHAHGKMKSRPLRVSTDAPRSITERWYDVATPRAVGKKAAQLQPALSSSREAPPGITIQGAEESIKAGKKRRKQQR